MGNDNFGTLRTVLCREAVLFSEGPLSEVPLYSLRMEQKVLLVIVPFMFEIITVMYPFSNCNLYIIVL